MGEHGEGGLNTDGKISGGVRQGMQNRQLTLRTFAGLYENLLE